MSAPDEQPYDSSTRGRYTFPTGQRRVVTVPSWARNLPPDELSDDEYDPPSFGPASGRPPGPQRRSLSSILRPTRNGSFSNPPHSAGATTAKSGDALLGDAERQRQPTQGNSEASTSSSPSPASPPPAPAPAKPAHIAAVLQRGNSAGQGGDKGWWTFTLPSKYLDRVHGYVRPKEWNEKGKEREGEQDDDDMRSTHSQRSRRSGWSMGRLQSRNRDQDKQDYHRKMSQSMNVKLAPPNVFSINQTTVPGWSSPWVPFHRQENGREMQDPFDLSHREAAAEAASKKSRFENFILHNPFSPLFFRFINLVLNGCTLGLAAHIRLQETHAGVIGVIGTSTLFVIVIAPLAIVHIFVTVYIEYFGAPIGLWQIRTKANVLHPHRPRPHLPVLLGPLPHLRRPLHLLARMHRLHALRALQYAAACDGDGQHRGHARRLDLLAANCAGRLHLLERHLLPRRLDHFAVPHLCEGVAQMIKMLDIHS